MSSNGSSSAPVVYQRRVKGVPRAPLVLSVAAAAGLYWLGGLGGWGSLLFGAVQFTLMTGFKFYYLFYKTVPRDIRWLLVGVMMKLALRRKTSQRKMVYNFLTETAKKFPNKTAIINIGINGESDRTLTFRELEGYINQIANYFSSIGVKKGDSVALFLENCPESYAIYLGLAKLGAISAMINVNLRQDSLVHCIKVSQSCAIVLSSSLGGALRDVWEELETAVRDHAYCVGSDAGVSGVTPLEGLLKDMSKQPPPPVRDRTVNDTLLYVYTSGTTGMPKACNVDDSKLFRSPIFFETAAGINSSDCVYLILPLYHTHGLVHCGGPMIYNGCTLVMRRKFSATNFWTDCIKYNCTMACTIGELNRYVLAAPPQPTDTQHKVRLIITAGLHKELWLEFQKRFKVKHIIEFYGSTEGNFGFINIDNKPGSIGPLPLFVPSLQNITFLKRDPDTGNFLRDANGFCIECGVNEPGETVCEITKAAPFHGYRNKESSEKKILRNCLKPGDAYFMTGDVMYVDEEGWVYFCDRTGDTFRWKGENVSTTEVEARMAHILGLTDVVVYGVEVAGNEGRAGMAAIVGSPESVDLRELPSQLSLSLPAYAVPLFVRLIKTAELTGTYKLRKVQLRKEGFDVHTVSDPLYLLRDSSYVPLTEELHQQLLDGTLRL